MGTRIVGPMNCAEVQTLLHDFRKRRLDRVLHGEVGAHLEKCTACARADRAEEALDEVLEQRLPRHAAPTALKRRLGLLMGQAAPVAAPPAAHRTLPLTRWTRFAAPAMAAGLALLVGGVFFQRSSSQGNAALASLTGEAVNDHLRVLASQHPVDIESGGNHQVKPWFEGKLDFAPEVPSPEDTQLRLRGGSVGYVFDRKAAVLVYALRQHVVTLLVFRAEGLAELDASAGQLGPERSARGFNVVLWRSGELGYALVSDANAQELGELGVRLAAAVHEPGP
jgi:anti-sigma factor RsiW